MAKKGKIHIGTSGWNYEHWSGVFYPPDLKQNEWLKFYTQKLHTVEINSSFYHLPREKTFEKWSATVPNDFIFSVKASRYITHVKKLNDPEEPVKKFIDAAKCLNEKLGPILFQLPPNLNFNNEKFCDFINVLPDKYRYTFEFRNSSWWNEITLKLLEENNLSFCIFELGELASPKEVTADFVYVRLHGHEEKYRGSYTKRLIAGWVKDFKKMSMEGKDVYCYFDNDEGAYAAKNAIEMHNLCFPS
jgi:uncharacterized protein YecE (DUF72 family)